MGIGVRDRVVEKVISTLKSVVQVTKFVGTGSSARIYGSHLSLIKDYVLPAVSIHIMPGGSRKTDNAFEDEILLQIEPWFNALGANGHVWDDAGIVESLHREKMTDASIGIKVIEFTQITKGSTLLDDHGVMHLPSRWRVLAAK